MDERSYIDIAQILDVPRGTVKSRLYEARQRLRNILLGYVKDVKSQDILLYKSAAVRIAVDYSRLEEVLCVK